MFTPIVVSTLSFLSLALAQSPTSTVSLYIPGADPQGLIGYVAGTASSLTTYVLSCADPSEECGFRGAFTITENASKAKYTMAPEMGDDGVLAFTARIDCALSPSTAVCIESFGGSDANFPGQSTETYTGTDYQSMPVLITATNTSPATATAATTSASITYSTLTVKAGVTQTLGGSGSGSGSASGAKQTSTTASGAGAGTPTSSTSVGVAPAIRGNARWVSSISGRAKKTCGKSERCGNVEIGKI
ncbi:uncharacterized protein RCO7_10891 [Rhynchosporium graminicola]|uniref:Uncharacterized protein n=1 Tax=Rhynchosporium graminicola TaxID=2792576 RepID=A0A1E1LBQ5_9HELO|nr:uncharacterized protein RCO7_10891 [Rhynchosporium commune]